MAQLSDNTYRDLFGQEVAYKHPGKNKGRNPEPKGYAARPGSGPAGETCKSCANYSRRYAQSGYFFRKCLLLKRIWTKSARTDVKAGSPACKYWKNPEEEQNNGKA